FKCAAAYYRITLPESDRSFGFMYSTDDPVGGKPHSGGTVQSRLVIFFPDSSASILL
ncbi:MAG TPA: hypothetical protein DEA78_25100, partial [Cyanobacteria bacterium UBA11159]|nr:hypothetical protein [Cyanobacteria bacterium UBA11366]HBR76862.1 hypothetical protein [Cyanobacteria bacterium UBA11159]HBS69139.1 hypothetical protein [Cyanobacteria bacterium UBA11153]